MSPDRRDPTEYPRSEPEIIPAGCDERAPRGPVGLWVHMDSRDGVHRVMIGRPGPALLIFGVLLIGFLAAVALLALAGFVLIWIPLVIAGILLAVASASLRQRWHQVQTWLTHRR